MVMLVPEKTQRTERDLSTKTSFKGTALTFEREGQEGAHFRGIREARARTQVDQRGLELPYGRLEIRLRRHAAHDLDLRRRR